MKAIIAFFLLTFILGCLGMDDTITLSGLIYDFADRDSGLSQAHPDFNWFTGDGPTTGMVEDQLGPDNVPVLIGNGKGKVTSADTFAQWFTSVPGTNIEIPFTMSAEWDEAKDAYKYENPQFFPIDGQGYGNEGTDHNFGFCFVFHSKFTYQKSQVFSFMGDDDVWVFINGELVIDLGGPHPPMEGSIELNTLGLTEGENYPFDFFYCERHMSGSSLRFYTSITLDPCGTDDADGDNIPDKCDPCPNGDQVLNVWNDKTISSNNQVTFHIAGTKSQTAATTIPVVVDFGDGETGSYDVPSTGISFSHTYEKSGDFDVTFTSEGVTGCGCADWTDSISLTCGGNKIAPKCSEIPLFPGSSGKPLKRKRSL